MTVAMVLMKRAVLKCTEHANSQLRNIMESRILPKGVCVCVFNTLLYSPPILLHSLLKTAAHWWPEFPLFLYAMLTFGTFYPHVYSSSSNTVSRTDQNGNCCPGIISPSTAVSFTKSNLACCVVLRQNLFWLIVLNWIHILLILCHGSL